MTDQLHDVQILPLVTYTFEQFAETIGYSGKLEVKHEGNKRCFIANLIVSKNTNEHLHASFVKQFQTFALDLMKAQGFIVIARAVYV